MTDTKLITKYRPQSLDEVLGQASIVKAITGIMKKKSSKSFLFTGPSGTGKTTLARIIASMAGCEPQDIREIDAATFTGIDDMRQVTAGLAYRPIGVGAVKAIIIDECHGLSKATFASLLKITEEPPDWVWWFFCTTEPTKIPAALKTRCTSFSLKPVPAVDIEQHLAEIAQAEKMKVSEDVIELCASEAGGSPRQGLANLATCATCTDKEEAADLLRSAADVPEAFELAQLLVKGGSLRDALTLIKSMAGKSPESIRHVVRAYVSTVILNSKTDKAIYNGLHILECFSEPFMDFDQLSPVILAVGRALAD